MDLILELAPQKEDLPEEDIADKDMNVILTKISKMKELTPAEMEEQRRKMRENRKNPFAINK